LHVPLVHGFCCFVCGLSSSERERRIWLGAVRFCRFFGVAERLFGVLLVEHPLRLDHPAPALLFLRHGEDAALLALGLLFLCCCCLLAGAAAAASVGCGAGAGAASSASCCCCCCCCYCGL
jgi:hypothetical protein